MENGTIRRLVYGCLFLSLGACQAVEEGYDDTSENASGVIAANVTDGDDEHQG